MGSGAADGSYSRGPVEGLDYVLPIPAGGQVPRNDFLCGIFAALLVHYSQHQACVAGTLSCRRGMGGSAFRDRCDACAGAGAGEQGGLLPWGCRAPGDWRPPWAGNGLGQWPLQSNSTLKSAKALLYKDKSALICSS